MSSLKRATMSSNGECHEADLASTPSATSLVGPAPMTKTSLSMSLVSVAFIVWLSDSQSRRDESFPWHVSRKDPSYTLRRFHGHPTRGAGAGAVSSNQ